MEIISDELAKKYLCQDLAKEKDSDEDGGVKTRVEFDSDFSWDESEENEVPEPEALKQDKEDWSKVLTKNRRKHNTGVKGVKADYEEAKQIMRRRNETKRFQDQEAFRRLAYGATTQEESVSYNELHKSQKGLTGSYVKTYDGDDEDESDDDDEFLQQYRQMRVSQIDEVSKLPQYGKVLYVDKFQFLDETDNTDPRTFVVVHVYEEYINACKRMNAIFDQLAAKFPHVKFLKMECTDASQTLSHRALPAFLVYREAELVNEATERVPSYLGTDEFTITDIEWLLASKYGINLPGVDISEKEKGTKVFSEGAESSSAVEWQPKAGAQMLGRVSLTGNRVAKSRNEEDDDWY